MPAVARRPRGNYAKLLCTRCRQRKIKCVLPASVSAPSAVPQPPEQACQRCRQHSYECIVDDTTRCRPVNRRPGRGEGNRAVQEPELEDVENYLLYNPRLASVPAETTAVLQSSKPDLSDSLRGPVPLLTTLLSRDVKFGVSVSSPLAAVGAAVDLVSLELARVLDSHLVWHRLYFPQIPNLLELRGATSDASKLLFVTLCSLALDVPSHSIARYRHLQPKLQAIVHSTGQTVLFSLPKERHAVLALQILGEYCPLIFAGTAHCCRSSVKGELFVVLARHIALQIGMDKPPIYHIDSAVNQRHVLDCMQWADLLLSESEAETTLANLVAAEACLDAIMETRRSHPDGGLPVAACYSYFRLLLSVKGIRAFFDAKKQWKHLGELEQVIFKHREACDVIRSDAETTVQQLINDSEESFVILQMVEAQIHLRHANVVSIAMFFAVMSSYYTEITAQHMAQITDHIIDRLTADEEQDPNQPSSRQFLETHGTTRMDELEKILTDFIGNAESLNLHEVPFNAPARNVAAEVLYTCKDIVENNAARLKGWGGMHERIDMQLILFQECARRLEAMDARGDSKEAIAKGSILAAAAKLIRSLHRILAAWKRDLAEARRRGVQFSFKTPDEGVQAATQTAMQDDGVYSFADAGKDMNSLFADDVFADWSMWPQIDPAQFCQMFTDEWEMIL